MSLQRSTPSCGSHSGPSDQVAPVATRSRRAAEGSSDGGSGTVHIMATHLEPVNRLDNFGQPVDWWAAAGARFLHHVKGDRDGDSAPPLASAAASPRSERLHQ